VARSPRRRGIPDRSGDALVPRIALVGARSCDLHGIAIQDRVFLDGAYDDPDYVARRRDAFVVAVNCGQTASTC
jgi:hypothetical protein